MYLLDLLGKKGRRRKNHEPTNTNTTRCRLGGTIIDAYSTHGAAFPAHLAGNVPAAATGTGLHASVSSIHRHSHSDMKVPELVNY
jgi:hypothetical protein